MDGLAQRYGALEMLVVIIIRIHWHFIQTSSKLDHDDDIKAETYHTAGTGSSSVHYSKCQPTMW